jgi:hypothetical protein
MPIPSPDPSFSCAVCGLSDARALTTTPLASGALAVVCGSHALAHGRADRIAESLDDLARMFGERRVRLRRAAYPGEVDELARALSAGFSPDRRRVGRRLKDG